ncbi:pyridoxamine 5'-phosphate oxidase family protein [Halobacterium litoreum]|uniref:Pyridoxamine 5'-phosphate oxidase family protein n=1 Tax=Halobacterium litoreum TaxID=2039234 RepID=A0ABD5NBV5_9EURY|nr:pyridoxamine 5'-phosphate oxidase family protein [Halobacterium litoreum]UHH14550.1 pyridoxamine 5'-phosphate oxidase family protein [Halobacterium litoreum]
MSVPEEAEDLIAGAPVSAHVATSVDDRPHAAPVWYGYRDGVVSFITGGRKLANARENPRVALSIERARDGDVAWNVTLLGRASVVDDADRIEAASDWIYDKYDGEGDEPSEETGAGGDTAVDGGAVRDEDAAGAEESGYALVEVTVGSASWAVYD